MLKRVKVGVRRLRAEEWQRWREMRLAMLQDSPEAFGTTFAEAAAWDDAQWQERVTALATSGDSALFIAEAGEEWAACGGGCEEEPGEILVTSVWTRPERRRQGLNTLVIEKVLDWGRETGRTSAALWVAEANAPARASYTRLGFTATGKTTLMREDIAELEMRRPL